jgi:hypothetical protein
MAAELPHEFDGSLDYDELVEMLGRVEGEPVFIHMGWGRSSERATYTLGLVGTLRRVPLDLFGEDPRFGDEAHFGVGSFDGLPCGAPSSLRGAAFRLPGYALSTATSSSRSASKPTRGT